MGIYFGNDKYMPDGISKVYFGSDLVFEKQHVTSTAIYFEALDEESQLVLSGSNSQHWSGSYSLDNHTWNEYTLGSIITLSQGDRVYFRGTITYSSVIAHFKFITTDNKFNVGGNILSLIYGSDFNKTSIADFDDVFYQLFQGLNIVDASQLVLSADTLSRECYYQMFYGCTTLVSAPELPATTLAYGCYNGMFAGCTSLINAPTVLPATILKQYCYNQMFYGCASLTVPPIMEYATVERETTYGIYTYRYMFYGCTSLNITEGTGLYKFVKIPANAKRDDLSHIFYNTANPDVDSPTAGQEYYYN